MGRREHTLRFTLGDESFDGTLAQVLNAPRPSFPPHPMPAHLPVPARIFQAPFYSSESLVTHGHAFSSLHLPSPLPMQVQEMLDSALRSTQLPRIAFFGQHGGGGLLDKTDAALKAELQSLLPLGVWESVRDAARLQASAAQEAHALAVGAACAPDPARARFRAHPPHTASCILLCTRAGG